MQRFSEPVSIITTISELDGEKIAAAGLRFYELTDEQRVDWASRLPNMPAERMAEIASAGQPSELVYRYIEPLAEDGHVFPRDWLAERWATLRPTRPGPAACLFSGDHRMWTLFGRIQQVKSVSAVADYVFAVISGVPVASAAVFSNIAAPEMRRLHDQLRFSLGIVASSAHLGMLIRPSILFIVSGVITE